MSGKPLPYGLWITTLIVGVIVTIYAMYAGARWVNWKLSYEDKVEETVYKILKKENLIGHREIKPERANSF